MNKTMSHPFLRSLRRLLWTAMILCLLLNPFTKVAAADAPLFQISDDTAKFLQQQSPGKAGIIARLAAGQPVSESEKKVFYARLEDGLLTGFPDAQLLCDGILTLHLLKKDPFNFQNQDLVSLLQQSMALQKADAGVVALALIVYDALEISPEGVRNSEGALLDIIASKQHRGGGFSPADSDVPNVKTTALAATALLNHRSYPVANTVYQKALSFLINSSRNGVLYDVAVNFGTCEGSAQTMILWALGKNDEATAALYGDKDAALRALNEFYNSSDGGYTATTFVEEFSSVASTELVMIARFALETGLLPFDSKSPLMKKDAPAADAPKPSAQEEKASALEAYGKFFLKFGIVLAAVFLLLPVTTWIGAQGEKHGWLGSLAREKQKHTQPLTHSPPAQSGSDAITKTLEIPAITKKESSEDEPPRIQLPEKPEIPDFSTFSEEDINGAQHQNPWTQE